MAVTHHKSSTTIRGITYNYGDTFKCHASYGGTSDSEGTGSAVDLTAGTTYYYMGYATGDDGNLTSYPYLVYVTTSTVRGWFKENVFPYATYTVTYNANGGSGAPSSQTKTHGTTLTLSSTTPTRSGYTFVGWGTSATDTSSNYSAGGSYTANASITLYAIWKKTITLTYSANGGSGAPSSQSATVYNATTSYTFTISSTKPTKTGYTFLGWDISSSATSASFQAGETITMSWSDTLHAIWSENKLTVNLYSNYADYGTYQGEALNVSASSNVLVLTKDYLYDNAYSDGLANIQNSSYLYLSKTGYTPTGYWGTSTSGGTLVDQSTSFSTGQALAEAVGKSLKNGNATINLYAQWRVNVLTIKYNVNGGTTNSDTYYTNNNLIYRTSSSSVLEDNWNYNDTHTNGLYNASTFGLTRIGYDFVGWKIGNSGTTIFDQNDTSIVPTDLASNITTGDRTITLYAEWKLSGVIYIDNGTEFEKYLVYIDNGSSWDLYLTYIDNGTSWDIMT